MGYDTKTSCTLEWRLVFINAPIHILSVLYTCMFILNVPLCGTWESHDLKHVVYIHSFCTVSDVCILFSHCKLSKLF